MTNGISLVRVGGMVVLMIEVYPTAFMLALEPDQAERLAKSILEHNGDDSDGELSLADLLRGKKPNESQ